VKATPVPWRLLGVSDLATITEKTRVPFDAWCEHWFAANRPTLDDATAIVPTPSSLEPVAHMAGDRLPDHRMAYVALGLDKPDHVATGSVAATLLNRLETEMRDDLLARLGAALGTSTRLLYPYECIGALPGGGARVDIRMDGNPLYRLVVESTSLVNTLPSRLQAPLEGTALSHAIAESLIPLEAGLMSVSLPIAQLAALETGDVIRLDLPLNGNAFLNASAKTRVAQGQLCQRAGRLCIQLVNSETHQPNRAAP